MKLKILLLLVLLMPLARADLIISEIMYDPDPVSDTDLEWIELYNNNTRIDLSDCKIDNSNFDDVIINPYEFIVVARELIDTSDEDLDSFENYYGNNDGIWDSKDGNYKAVDGSFSLTDDDLILIECPNFSLEVNYTGYGVGGKGYSMEKINLEGNNDIENWRKGLKDGSPGYYDSYINVKVEIKENLPEVTSFSMYPDDLDKEGIQILPLPGQKKRVYLEINTTSVIKDIKASFNGANIDMENNDKLEGYFDLDYYLKPGNYSVNLEITDDNDKTSYSELSFEYLPLLASSLDSNYLDFGVLKQGTSSETKEVKLKNLGNVDFDINVYGSDFNSLNNNLSVSSLEFYFEDNWNNLGLDNKLYELDLAPGTERDLEFRFNVPENIDLGVYEGKIKVIAVGQ
ncbi:MAG: lamin tail domain-containing protein [Candidatus Nanoarchaeia archaeon]|nr:lamin tail domain-containing protein [Candidatus Nanoarchaeia archaeon]